jgi:hypothetical protein
MKTMNLMDKFFDSPNWIIALIVAVVTLIIIGAVYEEREWQKYRDANNCVMKRHVRAKPMLVPMPDGNGGTHLVDMGTPSRTTYLCANGVEVVR